MIRAEGATFAELDTWIEWLDRAMDVARDRVMRRVADEIGRVRTAAAVPVPPPDAPPPGEPLVSLDTLGLIATLWAAEVGDGEGGLGGIVADIFAHGAEALAANAAGATAKRELTEPATDVLNSSLAEAYLAGARNRMVAFADHLWEVARAQLLEGFIRGESIDALRDRLVAVVGLTEGRARLVARTETIGASNLGSLALVEIAGFSGTKEWLATPDERARLAHMEADGQTVPIEGAFNVGGEALGFPGDPTGSPGNICNCRCTLTYELDDEPLTAAGDGMDSMDGMMPVTDEWIGVLALEGVPTGDVPKRMFMPGVISSAEFPLPLLRQPVTGDGHDGSVIVGNIERAGRSGTLIPAGGRFDLGGADGIEAHRMVRDGFLSGISIDVDNFEPSDIEYVYGPGPVGSPDPSPSVTMVIYHAGRLRGATLCAIPAFAEAKISLVPEGMRGEEMTILTAAAIPAHDTATVDGPWDADTAVGRLDSPMPVATARAEYAWIDSDRVEDGEVVKDALRFPHHEVSGEGRPGAANLTACSAGIAALHGARGGTTIPMTDRRGVYDHLRAHLIDGGREPDSIPEFDEGGMSASGAEGDGAMVAAAYVLTIPDVPPAEWFEEPTDVALEGALTVTDEGRIYGYLAPSGVAHRSFQRRVTVPMGNVDYSLYMGRETLVAGGARVVTGALTMDCGHADQGIQSGGVALDHYDNACSVVATVRIGENSGGVWVAGAVVPGVTASQLGRMMACQLSGDWRPHRERSGWREFAGALLVPVPGFAMTRKAPSVRVDGEGALVASAVPVIYASGESCGCASETAGEAAGLQAETTGPALDLSGAVDIIARSVGLDFASQAEMIRARVAESIQG